MVPLETPELRCTIEPMEKMEVAFLGQTHALRLSTNFRMGVEIYPATNGGYSVLKVLPPCCLIAHEGKRRYGVMVCNKCLTPLPPRSHWWFNQTDTGDLRPVLEAQALRTLGPLMNIMAVENFLSVTKPFLANDGSHWPKRKADFNLLTERPKFANIDFG